MKDRSIKLRSKDLGGGKYEVEGVVLYAESHAIALRKYLRQKKPEEAQRKDLFISFMKQHHAFDEYKKEIHPHKFGDLDEQFKDGAEFVLEDGCIFFWKDAVTDIYWEKLNAEWVALLKEENK